MRNLTYMEIKYICFCFYKWKWGTDFVLKNSKIILKIWKIGKHSNIFAFFIKTKCQSEEFAAFKDYLPISPTPPFLKKYFIPTLINQIRESQSPLYKGRGLNYDRWKKLISFLRYDRLVSLNHLGHTWPQPHKMFE